MRQAMVMGLAARRADELIRKATPRVTPPLDESVVVGSRAKQLQEQQKR